MIDLHHPIWVHSSPINLIDSPINPNWTSSINPNKESLINPNWKAILA